MKTIHTMALLMILSSGSMAQSLKLKDIYGADVTGDTIDLIFHPDTNHGWSEMIVEIFITNISGATIDVGAKKTEFNVQPDEYHSFCYGGTCFLNNTFVAPSAFIPTITGGASDSSFSGHYRFDDLTHPGGICHVAYTFYDKTNPADSAIVYVNYNTLLLSADDGFDKANMFLSEPWPCPSSGIVNINYRLNDVRVSGTKYMVVSNMFGQRMAVIPVAEREGVISVNAGDWASGTYCCSVISGNGTIVSRRFLINR